MTCEEYIHDLARRNMISFEQEKLILTDLRQKEIIAKAQNKIHKK